MKLVFIDPKCPRPYDPEVLATQGLGGTEATVVRIAGALSAEHEVTVFQHNRQSVWQGERGLSFKPIAALEQDLARADHLVFIQKAQDLAKLRRHSRGRWWLWLHNYVQEEVPLFWQDHLRYRLGIICVSRTHAEHTARYARRQPHSWLTARWALRGGLLYHHNPLNPGLGAPPDAAYDPYKLTFFSSPHKGLEQVVAQFRRIHEIEPRFRLHVADPGYLKNIDSRQLDHPGIVRLGSLPQTEVLRHVAESLCVFYPQTKRAETFGLVYAEANAVGTPVLAHDFGAAGEILVAGNPPLDAADAEAVQRTLFAWQQGRRPAVSADPRFSVQQVSLGWNRFFADPAAFIRTQGL